MSGRISGHGCDRKFFPVWDIFAPNAELENSVRRKNVRKDFRARM